MRKRNGMGRLALFIVALFVGGWGCQALTGGLTETEDASPPASEVEATSVVEQEPPQVATDPPAPSPEPTQPATSTPVATATTEPTPTAAEVVEGERFEEAGLAFSYPPSLASNIVVEEVPASDPGQDAPPFLIYPDHRVFHVEGYPLADAFQPPRIVVFPAQAYAEMNEWAAEEMNALAQLLSAQPASFPATEPLPFLPFPGAAQVFHAQEAYAPFQNGTGIRYVTAYAQDVWPITNEGLFYTYQGLSADGETYVSVTLPVRTDALPDEVDVENFDYEAFAANYEEYQRETQTLLTELEPDDFTPSLEVLDGLVASMQAGGGAAD
ncbi:MAG TPA: hypothetical protein VK879_20560 [Candidatus Sulfomarinibacteraceae bacterium]|nr:hypothetical protein [Candidatus Sulfomarinibacteraceae bacterium]